MSILRSFASYYRRNLHSSGASNLIWLDQKRYSSANQPNTTKNTSVPEANQELRAPPPPTGEIETAKEAVEKTAEVVEKIVDVAEKASKTVADESKDGKLKEAAKVVEKVSEKVEEDARLVEDIIHKVDEIEGDVETLVGKHNNKKQAR